MSSPANPDQQTSQQENSPILSQTNGGPTSGAQPMFSMMHAELGTVSADQYKKTGFLPPAQKLNIHFSDDDNEEDNEEINDEKLGSNSGSKGGLNPFQQGYLDQKFYSPFQQSLPQTNGPSDSANPPVTKE